MKKKIELSSITFKEWNYNKREEKIVCIFLINLWFDNTSYMFDGKITLNEELHLNIESIGSLTGKPRFHKNKNRGKEIKELIKNTIEFTKHEEKGRELIESLKTPKPIGEIVIGKIAEYQNTMLQIDFKLDNIEGNLACLKLEDKWEPVSLTYPNKTYFGFTKKVKRNIEELMKLYFLVNS